MKCRICGGDFYPQTLSEPADTCDCGQEISQIVLRQMDEAEIGAARQRWKEMQDVDGHSDTN